MEKLFVTYFVIVGILSVAVTAVVILGGIDLWMHLR